MTYCQDERSWIFLPPVKMAAAKENLHSFCLLLCFQSLSLAPVKVLGNKPSTAKCTGGGLGGCYNFFLSWVWIGKEIIALLRLRAGDEKTTVRKSALQVWCFLHDFLFCMVTQNATGTNN